MTSTPPLHLFIVAGEESGDAHAAAFLPALWKERPSLKISAMGGKHLKAAGAELIYDLTELSLVGVSAVLRHAKKIYQAWKIITRYLKETKPDLVILVDYPGFNLRLAKYAKKELGLRTLYYIAPQLWAWKANRIQTMAACIDTVAVIFPFEKAIYEKAKIPVHYVGNPLVEKIEAFSKANVSLDMEKLQLPSDKQLIALLPGSRISEIKRHLPLFIDTIQELLKIRQDLHFIMPLAKNLDRQKIEKYFKKRGIPLEVTLPSQKLKDISPLHYNQKRSEDKNHRGVLHNLEPCSKLPLSIVEGQALEVLSAADFAVVASGTASLEASLLLTPLCVVYQSSFLNEVLAGFFIKVKYLSLSNILSNKMIVPELLQYDCSAQALTQLIQSFLDNAGFKTSLINHLSVLKAKLSTTKSEKTIEALISEKLEALS